MARQTGDKRQVQAPRGADPASERAAATLDLVLNTSTELFAERGYAGATMRELADRAKVPLSTFYYYFRSKYDVLLAIMDTAQGRLERGGEEVWDESLAPDAQLRALVDRHVRIHLMNPEAARVADGELRALQPPDRDAIVARRDRYEQRFRDVIEAGRGDCFRGDLDVAVAGILILTMSTAVIDWWQPKGRYSAEETAALIGAHALDIAGAHR
jgi:AcrR family transcriptional regulator